MEAHGPVIAADGSEFVTCSCGLRCGSLYFHALHSEEQLAGPAHDHATAWPAPHLATVPRALWPQPGVIARNTHDLPATEYTTARLAPGTELESLRAALRIVPTLGRDAGADIGCAMVAFGARPMTALSAPHPEDLVAFPVKLAGDNGAELLPAGRSDLLLFVKSTTAEAAAASTAAFLAAAGATLEAVETTVGFLNDGRDLSGAIDGTKNPDQSLRTVVDQGTIGPRDYPDGDHLGGSFVFCSKFAHRMATFYAMPETEQAGVFGRDLTKEQVAKGSDSRVENPKVGVDVQGSHVYRAWGEMYRQSMAFREQPSAAEGVPREAGEAPEEGLLFIAFARKIKELEDALNRMCGNEDGQCKYYEFEVNRSK